MLWSIKNRVKNISIATVLILGFNACSVFHVVECKSNLQRKVSFDSVTCLMRLSVLELNVTLYYIRTLTVYNLCK